MKNKLLFNLLTPFATSNTQCKTFRNLLALVMVMVFGGTMTGQVFSGNYSFASANGNVASLTYNGIAISNLTVGALVKTGVTTASSSGNSRSTGWSTGSTDAGSAGGSVDLGKYYEFTITAGSGYTISNPTLTYGVGRSGSGTRRFQWRWDIDSYGSALIVGTANAGITNTLGVLETPDANSGYTGNVVTASTSGQTSITFRFYAYGSESATGTGGLQGNLTFGGTLSSSNPTIIATGTLGPFISADVSTPSSEQSFTVSGSNLTNDIVITPPTGYQISTSTGGSFSPTNPITLTQSSGTVASTTIYASFNPTALVDQVGGNIAISTTGATTQNVAVSGEVTNLSAGAIAFVAFQGASLDLYRIVALNDIPNNTRIWFTDKSWDGGTLSFFSGEGNNVWTNTTGSTIAAGTVIQFDAAGGATLGTGGLNSGLGSTGEQLFAYQGTLTSPTFVAGYTSGTVITTGVTTSSATYVPAGLTSGTNFVALGGTTIGSSYVTVATHNRSLADLRSHIHNTANLTTGDTSNPTNGSWPTYTFNISNNWTGGTGNWNTAANWSLATVPSSSDHVTISSGSPVLDVDYTLPVGKTLTLSGTGGLTINSGKILTIAGTADFGGKSVTIKSDLNGTGAIGEVTGTLSSATNVTVERYIPAKRAWRALTAPVSTTTSISANWQENASDPGAGFRLYGFDIWNPNGGTGILTGGSGSSLLSYNSATNDWTGITNTTDASTMMNTNGDRNKPFIAFVTGPYGSGNITAGATETTLRATGTLFSGTQSYESASGEYTFIGNPYASPLNLYSLLTDSENVTNFGTNIWVWDAKAAGTNTVGAYNTFDSANSLYTNNTTSTSGDSNITTGTLIQSGQAFFVKQSSGSSVDFKIKEEHKGTTFSNAVFRQASVTETLRVGLYKQVNNEWIGKDGAMTVLFAQANVNQLPNKMANGTENVAFTKNGLLFASEHHLPLVASDVLNVKVWNTTAGTNYKLKINTEQFNTTNLNATLEDLFTNARTPLTLDGTVVEYPFAVTTEAASTGNRFRIVFENSALGLINPKATGISILPNPITGDAFQVNLGTLSTGTYSYSISNTLGQEVEKGNINNVTQNSNYTVKFKNSTANGMYIMKVTGTDNSVFTAKIIKQ